MKKNILHITPDFNYACGRSYYVFQLLKHFKKKNRDAILLTNGGDSFDRLDELGISYIKVRNLHSKNIITFLKNVGLIKEIISAHNIDIVHSHHRYSELLATQAAKSLKHNRLKTVLTALSIVKRKYNIEYRSDRIIAVSNTVKNILIRRFGIPDSRISMIGNFTDTEEIHELEVLAQTSHLHHNRTYNILAIGRFHYEKNFEILLKALHIIGDKRIKLILVGEGDKHIDYMRYIKRHNLNVEIVVPQKNLIEYFLIADLCILPSARDPFPNFMLQAGLHKKPFIGANVDGIGELIRSGENGLLFKNGDANELAQKILEFKNDHLLAKFCALELFNEVINNYTQEFIAPKIEKLYQDLA